MFFLTIWEMALFGIFMLDLADDMIWDQLKFDIFQYDVSRAWAVIILYSFSFLCGKVRLQYFFLLIFYLVLGSAYIFTETDMHSTINYLKFPVLFLVAIFSPSHDLEVTGKYGVGCKEFR